MRNKKTLMLLPIAVLSLGAIIGCNNGGSNVDTEDETAIDAKIDEALVLPENLVGLNEYEAKEICKSAVKSFDGLIGVESELKNSREYSKLLTGGYTKLAKDYVKRFKVDSTRYSNQTEIISTTKYDKEIVEDIVSNSKSTRTDTIWFDGDEPEKPTKDNLHCNVDYVYQGIDAENKLQRNVNGSNILSISGEGSPYEGLTSNELLLQYDRFKLGNDNNALDYDYFARSDENNVYMIKLTNESETIANPFDTRYTFNIVSSKKIVCHFIKNGDNYYIHSYAYEEKSTCDKDVQGIVFDTPVEILCNKYVNVGKYGSSSSYVGTLEDYEHTAITEYCIDAYLPVEKDKEGKESQEKDYDNCIGLYDNSITAKALDPTFEGNILLPASESKDSDEQQQGGKTSYTNPSPLTMVNLVYEDSYGAQTKSRNYDYTYLSANHEYCFGNPKPESEEVFGFSSVVKGGNPYFDVIKGSNEDYFKVTVSGYYNINVYVPETKEGETRKATLNIDLVMPYEDSRYTQDYAQFSVTFDKENLYCEYDDDDQEEPTEIESGDLKYRRFEDSGYYFIGLLAETQSVLTLKDSNITISHSDGTSPITIHPSLIGASTEDLDKFYETGLLTGFTVPAMRYYYEYLDEYYGIAKITLDAQPCDETNVSKILLGKSREAIAKTEGEDNLVIDSLDNDELNYFTFNSKKDGGNTFNILINGEYPDKERLVLLDESGIKITEGFSYDSEHGNLTVNSGFKNFIITLGE